MKLKKWLSLAASLAFGAAWANAGTLSYTCDPSIDATMAGTCNVLNTTIAGLYGSTFSNANADIYITYGATGLGQSNQFLNLVSYNTYQTALTADSVGTTDPVRLSALASLPLIEPPTFTRANINVTAALGTALGIAGMVGTTAGGAACFTPGAGSCYDAVITIATPASLAGAGQGLYYRAGAQPGNDYDFYTVVEHETDETLGTSSCIDTAGALSDGCGGTNASAVDLFRYQGPGNRVFQSTTPGAYFSYDGGVTNGAAGAPYNTLANGDDYADFTTNCAHVQDATGCLGQSFDITNDAGSEINILDAVGYNLAPAAPPPVPEPGTLALFGGGFVVFAGYLRRKRTYRDIIRIGVSEP